MNKHCTEIIAWAQGKAIEQRDPNIMLCSMPPQRDPWRDFTGKWCDSMEYRIKPEPPAKSYPVTGMSDQEILTALCEGVPRGFPMHQVREARYVANAALRHAIDSGQVAYPVVTVTYYGDMAEAVKRNPARDLAIAEAVMTAFLHSRFTITGNDGIDLPAIIATVKE